MSPNSSDVSDVSSVESNLSFSLSILPRALSMAWLNWSEWFGLSDGEAGIQVSNCPAYSNPDMLVHVWQTLGFLILILARVVKNAAAAVVSYTFVTTAAIPTLLHLLLIFLALLCSVSFLCTYCLAWNGNHCLNTRERRVSVIFGVFCSAISTHGL